ncbi:MAG: hypothetical protein IJU95_09940 [Treponema sp.]|nr:hypothetical protein [Treponema sp.]
MNPAQEIFPGWEGIFSSQRKPGKGDDGLEELIHRGLASPDGKKQAQPARHLSSLLNQIAFSHIKGLEHFDTLLAPFAKEDGLDYREIKQLLQGLAYALLYQSKDAEAAPTKIYLDSTCPEELKDKNAVVAGRELSYSYGLASAESAKIGQAVKELMSEGNCEGKPIDCIKLITGADSSAWDEELPQGINYELFTMKSCKKCAAVQDFLALSNLEGEEVDVGKDRGFDRASEAGVFVTPTVIFYNREKEELARAHNVQELESVLVLLRKH